MLNDVSHADQYDNSVSFGAHLLYDTLRSPFSYLLLVIVYLHIEQIFGNRCTNIL
jgi:hypothetical protein